jgi:hypothetical protein
MACPWARRLPCGTPHVTRNGSNASCWVNGFATSYFSTSKVDPSITAEAETLLRIAHIGWGRKTSEFRKVFATRFAPSASPQYLDVFDRMQQRANEPEIATRSLEAMFRIDVRPMRVRCAVRYS